MISSGSRLEDGSLVVGSASFVADLIDDRTLHCAFVRSPIAHGTFARPDLTAARAMPGVVTVVDSEELGLGLLPSSPGRGAPPAVGMGQPILARHTVRHVGEPIAVVVAESVAQAIDAAEEIWVDIEDLPVVAGAADALTDEVLLFPDTGTNLVHRQHTESTTPEPAVEVEVEVTVDIPRLSPVTIEPLAFLARPLDPGLEVWCGHQSPGRLPRQLGEILEIDPALIRARVPNVGGAFGTKGQFYVEYAVVAALALRLGRPVAWIQLRREQLVSGTHGRGQSIRVRMGGDHTGRIRKSRVEILAEVGAYPSTGARIPFFTLVMSQGQYDFEYLAATATAVVSNRAPTGPYRGAGRPEAAILIERAVDEFAVAVGLAPEEVRRLNYIAADAFPFVTNTGAIYDSGNYAAALEVALEASDIGHWRELQSQRLSTGGKLLGIGIGSFVERAGGEVESGEYGKVELLGDGTVTVRTGSTAAGQGHRSVWSRLAGEVLTVGVDRVEFIAGDTAEVPSGVGSFGSRSAQVGASAIHRTAWGVREQATRLAAQMLEASEQDLELVDGVFRVTGSPGSDLSLGAVASYAESAGIPLSSDEVFVPGAQTFPYGVCVAVVEVDVDTGEVVVVALTAVDDCGNLLDPMIVEGQVHGSIMQGLGSSLLEEFIYDTDGQPLTSSMMSYLIPSSTQPMPLTTRRLFTPAPSNPLGVKGTGESGCIGIPPAILNATLDAVRFLGVDSLDLPVTPRRVWEAIQSGQVGNEERTEP